MLRSKRRGSKQHEQRGMRKSMVMALTVSLTRPLTKHLATKPPSPRW
uniref:Uncharacterized protein n=1 Tax=Arundo donax TaxID=35708 RepID=A0A0A8Y3Y2_ARUDO